MIWAVAVLFHLLSLLLFHSLTRRLMDRRDALVATLLFAVLPMGAFFGRMVNHEPLCLAPSCLVVQGYWSYLNRNRGGLILASVAVAWGALMGWMIFLGVGAAVAHGSFGSHDYDAQGQDSPRWPSLELALLSLPPTWRTFCSYNAIKAVTSLGPCSSHGLVNGGGFTLTEWLEQNGRSTSSQLHDCRDRRDDLSRNATATCRDPFARFFPFEIEPGEEVAGIFLLAGLGYLVFFPLPALKHHYWQFPLLPASALATTFSYGAWPLEESRVLSPAKKAATTVLIWFFCTELVATSAFTLFSVNEDGPASRRDC